MSCRDHLAQLRERQTDLDRLNIAVAVVTFEAGPVARAYLEEARLPWPVLIDDQLSLYHAYGMGRGRWGQLMGPKAIWFYLKIMLRGGRVRRPTGDVMQLGGNVLIDPTGIVRLHEVAEDGASRPSVQSQLDIVETTQHQR